MRQILAFVMVLFCTIFGQINAQTCIDSVPPQLVCPANTTVAINGNTPINLPTASVPGDIISSWTTTVNGVESPGNGGWVNLHLSQNTVVYTAYDLAGNSGTCTTLFGGISSGQITGYFNSCDGYISLVKLEDDCGVHIRIEEAIMTLINSVATENTKVTVTGPGLPAGGWVKIFSPDRKVYTTPALAGGTYQVVFHSQWASVGGSPTGPAECSMEVKVPLQGTMTDPCKYFSLKPGFENCNRGIWISDSILSNCGPTIETNMVDVYPEGMPQMPVTPNGGPVDLSSGKVFIPNLAPYQAYTAHLTVVSINNTDTTTTHCSQTVTIPKPMGGVELNCDAIDIQITPDCQGGYVKVFLDGVAEYLCNDKDGWNNVYIDGSQSFMFGNQTELDLGHFDAATHNLLLTYQTNFGFEGKCKKAFVVEEIPSSVNWICETATAEVVQDSLSCGVQVTLNPPVAGVATCPTPIEWTAVGVLGANYSQMFPGQLPQQVVLNGLNPGTYEVVWKATLSGATASEVCWDTFTVAPFSGVSLLSVSMAMSPNGPCNSDVAIGTNTEKCGCLPYEWGMYTLDGPNGYHQGEMFSHSGLPGLLTFTNLEPGDYNFVRVIVLDGDPHTYVDTFQFAIVPGPCCGSSLEIECPVLAKVTIHDCAGEIVAMPLPEIISGCGTVSYSTSVKHGGVNLPTSVSGDSVYFFVTQDLGFFAYSITFTVTDGIDTLECGIQFFSVGCDGNKVPVGPQDLGTVSVFETDEAEGLKVYPNPASGMVNITGASGSVSIIDAFGRVVIESSDVNHTFSVTGFAPGFYFVKDDENIVKLIVQR